MSENTLQTNNPGATDLRPRLNALRQRAAQAASRWEKRRKVLLIAGFGVIVLCVVCLGRFTRLAMQLDANALTEIGRLQVERHLPESRTSIEEHLKREAPKVINEALSACIGLLPTVREQVISDLMGRLDAITVKYEGELGRQIVTSIRAAKANLDQTTPEQSDVEKMEALVQHTCDQFNLGFSNALETLYPSYVSEMNRVNEHLWRLSKTESEKLTPRERTEKEIIETFLRMMIREQKRRF